MPLWLHNVCSARARSRGEHVILRTGLINPGSLRVAPSCRFCDYDVSQVVHRPYIDRRGSRHRDSRHGDQSWSWTGRSHPTHKRPGWAQRRRPASIGHPTVVASARRCVRADPNRPAMRHWPRSRRWPCPGWPHGETYAAPDQIARTARVRESFRNTSRLACHPSRDGHSDAIAPFTKTSGRSAADYRAVRRAAQLVAQPE